MKYNLGLDLGSGSIGWAIISKDEATKEIKIVDLGCRIVPIEGPDITKFNQGQAYTKNAERTIKRTIRKGYFRFKMRRDRLTQLLRKLNMLPDEDLIKLPQLKLWELRSKSVKEKISLQELGRVLYHLNQKRGYKASKSDLSNSDKKIGEYVKSIKNRYDLLHERNETIGEYFYSKLKENEYFRCKDNIFPRAAYLEEFDAIMNCQRKFYPEILTQEVFGTFRNEIIYYQRNLKSCKHLVSICEFEKKEYINKYNGEIVISGPKVAPKSSPIYQVCKLWESINNIILKNKTNASYNISLEYKKDIFDFLQTHESLKVNDLYKILGIKKNEGWWGGKAIGKGIKGDTTLLQISNALCNKYPELLRYDLTIDSTSCYDRETGEVYDVISPSCEEEPLNQLWHTLYSISEKDELENVLRKKFGIKEDYILNNLFALDFVKAGYGNKSTKCIRRILPYLQLGSNYSDACAKAGFRHSESLTSEENLSRILSDRLEYIQKNSLRQPIVEKILNQLVNVVNALMEKYGQFDEIRVELARELKQSREERKLTFKEMNKNQKQNDEFAKLIQEDEKLTPTRTRIQKYKLYRESGYKCMYCGAQLSLHDFLQGFDAEVEHIIPKTLLFDDSFSNKVCSCRKCNQEKNDRTAYDFMKSKGDVIFDDYIRRVNELFKIGKITKPKFERLMTPKDKIPTDFINRQLRESQYISRKAMELLRGVCRNVYATSGSVTDFLRHTWGWDNVLHSLNFDRYKAGGLTEVVEVNHNGCKYQEERIIAWSKRLDHRHHAIDALVIACTTQGYIQRINNLSTLKDNEFKSLEYQSDDQKQRHSSLEKYILSMPHFTTAEVSSAVSRILISLKPGKKVVTKGKRYIFKGGKRKLVQENILIPRGALCNETIYGRIKRYKKNKSNVNFEDKYVTKYQLAEIDRKKIDSVIDSKVKKIIENRLKEYGYDVHKAYAEPLYYDDVHKQPIKSVRCITGLSAVVPLRYNDNGEPISFVKPDNNHHIAFYIDEDGNYQEHVVTFWEAVERRKYGMPSIIDNPQRLWDEIQQSDIIYPDPFLISLPDQKWSFKMSLQQNEMFVLGLSEDEFKDAIKTNDLSTLSSHLYKVQNISNKTYRFNLHTQTQFDLYQAGKPDKRYYNFSSIKSLFGMNPHKVRINVLGEIKDS